LSGIKYKQISTHLYIERTDEELAASFGETGDQQLLASLYLRYHELLYGVCLKYLKDQDTAKDAVIGIYESLVKKLRTNKVDNFKPWLYVFAKNYCLMELRKAKKDFTSELSEQHMYSEDFEHLDNVLMKEKQLNTLENCIEELADNQKQIIRLFYIEEKCYNDIVEQTGLEWNKVRSMVQNGRRNLKICMERNEA
jgi:RNA polymerase sigma factor (sigma-70 family)